MVDRVTVSNSDDTYAWLSPLFCILAELDPTCLAHLYLFANGWQHISRTDYHTPPGLTTTLSRPPRGRRQDSPTDRHGPPASCQVPCGLLTPLEARCAVR